MTGFLFFATKVTKSMKAKPSEFEPNLPEHGIGFPAKGSIFVRFVPLVVKYGVLAEF